MDAAHLINSYGYFAVFLALVLETTIVVGLVVPGVGVLIAAGFLAGVDALSLWLVLVAGLGGVLLGDNVAYVLGRRFLAGSRCVQRLQRRFPAIGNEVGRVPWYYLFFQFPMPMRVGIPILAGSARLKIAKWLLLDLCASAIFVPFLAVIGYVAGKASAALGAAQDIGSALDVIFLSLFAAWIVILVTGVLKQRIKSRSAPIREIRQLEKRWQDFADKNTDVTIDKLSAEDLGLDETLPIRASRIRQLDGRPRPTVVFVPGYLSTIYTWRFALPPIISEYDVIYCETAEKLGGRVLRDGDLAVDSIGATLNEALLALDRSCAPEGIIAASTGANVVLEVMMRNRHHHVGWLVLLMPHISVPVPSWARYWRAVPGFILNRIKWLVLFVLQHRKGLTAQGKGMVAALEASKLARVRDSVLEWRRYKLDLSRLSQIEQKVLVVGVSNDELHRSSASYQIADLLQADRLEVSSFGSAHSSRLAYRVLVWVEALTK